MRLAFFRGALDNAPQSFDVDFPRLVEVLRTNAVESPCTRETCVDKKTVDGKRQTCPYKLNGFALSAAVYPEGAKRAADNVEALTILVGDLDHVSRATYANVLAMLEGAGIAFAMYSTHGHLAAGEDDMALRVLFPLDKPIDARDYRRFWLAFVDATGLPLDKVAKSAASLFFMPNRPTGTPFLFESREGVPLPVDNVLARAMPREPEVPRVSPIADADFSKIDGDARRTLLRVGHEALGLVPGGEYGPQKLGRRMTCYNLGHTIGGLDGRVPGEDALEWLANLIEPPLTPGGACEKALRDGFKSGKERPFPHDELTRLTEYAVGPGFWDLLNAVAKGAPDAAVPIMPTVPPQAPAAMPSMSEPVPVYNITMYRGELDRMSLLAHLKKDKNDKIINCGANVSLILRHLFPRQFRFNTLTKGVDASRSIFRHEGPDTLANAIANYLTLENDIGRELGLTTNASVVAGELLAVASENAFNPLREYLTGLVWDGVPRIDTWLETYAHAAVTDSAGADLTGYVRMVGARWLLSAAARALYPGCKADCVLVLEGNQGFKKSTLFDILGGEWFNDTPLVIGDKDANLGAGSNWIHELAELASLRKTESEQQKAFLSSRTDRFRVPYGRVQQTFPRSCIFAGTTNADTYLHDYTGNRRYWCVFVTARCDAPALKRDRDQLWAEAVARLAVASPLHPDWRRPDDHEQGPEGERWWLEPDEQLVANDVTEARMGESAVDSYMERIADYTKTAGEAVTRQGYTLSTLALKVLEIPVQQHTPTLMRDVANALRRLCWEHHGKARPRRWYPPRTSM
jgi:hypothetical protein